MEMNSPLIKAFTFYCQKNHLNIKETSFFLGSRELKHNDTPEDTMMKNDDIINILNKKVDSQVQPTSFIRDLNNLFAQGLHSDVVLQARTRARPRRRPAPRGRDARTRLSPADLARGHPQRHRDTCTCAHSFPFMSYRSVLTYTPC